MKLDLIGCVFGRLKVVSFAKSINGRTYWNCICDCGNKKMIMGKCLTSGNTKSCGCLHNEKIKYLNLSHGKSTTRFYKVWRSMLSRCENPNTINYYLYGNRGIKVCSDWHKFTNFYNWAMSNGYKSGLSIDRIDNSGSYCPENCRWANRFEQNNNTRTNKFLELYNKKQTIAQWSREIGISQRTLHKRLELGWTIEKTLTTPLYGNGRRLDLK